MIALTPLFEADFGAASALESLCFTDGVSPEAFCAFVRAEANHYWAAKHDGELVGYGGFSLAADEAEILSVAVSPLYRCRGIGRMLTEQMLAAAAALGAGTMYLEVRQSNRAARALYLSLGFEETGVRRQYYTRPREDAILMMRRLEAQADTENRKEAQTAPDDQGGASAGKQYADSGD